MAEPVNELFAEYAAAYVDGLEPQAQDYLERAGDDADELAGLLDGFLAAAPRPRASADATALVAAWMEGEPPLVHLRASHGVRVDDVVDAIVEEAGIAEAKRARVKRYYQRLEEGLLDPSGVSERVWNVVRRLVGPIGEVAASWRPRATTVEPAFYRGDLQIAHGLSMPALRQSAPAPERDEVDELFTRSE